ncbi:MAG: hypothetical protein PHY40_01045 [Patescibacteria group bacterium]|nr:hypothetical protein [Patescibacteria group bacterium]
MTDPQLNKILKLIRRTGDRCAILDKDTDSAFMMMSIGEYEKLLDEKETIRDLNEEEMLNKINRDISVWRSEHEKKEEAKSFEIKDEHIKKNEEDGENFENFGDVDINDFKKDLIEEEKEIEKIQPEETEESLADIPSDAPDEEEDRYYLEPVA